VDADAEPRPEAEPGETDAEPHESPAAPVVEVASAGNDVSAPVGSHEPEPSDPDASSPANHEAPFARSSSPELPESPADADPSSSDADPTKREPSP
jgi:hypothetical protein